MTKDELIDKYREINVDFDDWCDYMIEDFVSLMDSRGIEVNGQKSGVPAVYWSGFWSQGDGACFEGHIRTLDFMDAHKLEYPMIRKLFELRGGGQIRWHHTGRYYHEKSLRYEEDYDTITYMLGDAVDEFEAALIDTWQEQLEDELFNLNDSVVSLVEQYCQDLYWDLEKEYDCLTSDEVVWERIVDLGLDEELEVEDGQES